MTDISLADKGECLNLLDCLKGYALVPVTLNRTSSYLYCALNILIGATVSLNYFIACLQASETIDPCPSEHISEHTYSN